MPNRILRDGILTSERVNSLSCEAELFYRRLMSVVDDYGRFDARPAMLRSYCYPLRVTDICLSDVSSWLSDVSHTGLVEVYEVEGKPYLQLTDFRQRNRCKSSRYPENDGHATVICQPDDGHMTARARVQCGGGGGGGGDSVCGGTRAREGQSPPTDPPQRDLVTNPPSDDELDVVADQIGVSREWARQWRADRIACGWRRGDEECSPIKNWPRQMTIDRDRDRANHHEQPKAGAVGTRKPWPSELKAFMDHSHQRYEDFKSRHKSVVAGGSKWDTPEHQKKGKELLEIWRTAEKRYEQVMSEL